MTSWAVVADVWYLEPQEQQPGRTASHSQTEYAS